MSFSYRPGERLQFRQTVIQIIGTTVIMIILFAVLCYAGSYLAEFGTVITILLVFCYIGSSGNLVWRFWKQKHTTELLDRLTSALKKTQTAGEVIGLAIPAGYYNSAEPTLKSLPITGQLIVTRENLVFVRVPGRLPIKVLSGTIDYSRNPEEGLQLPGSFTIPLGEIIEVIILIMTTGLPPAMRRTGGLPYLKVQSKTKDGREETRCFAAWVEGNPDQQKVLGILNQAITNLKTGSGTASAPAAPPATKPETQAVSQELASGTTCRNCGTSLDPAWVACPACGADVKPTCPNCKAPVDPAWVACPSCGQDLEKTAHSQKEPPNQ